MTQILHLQVPEFKKTDSPIFFSPICFQLKHAADNQKNRLNKDGFF